MKLIYQYEQYFIKTIVSLLISFIILTTLSCCLWLVHSSTYFYSWWYWQDFIIWFEFICIYLRDLLFFCYFII